uniref:RRM domain-containing protein n=1 Tax=Strigamia maritima TaxID=126957 RepID=T1JGH8_STRMM
MTTNRKTTVCYHTECRSNRFLSPIHPKEFDEFFSKFGPLSTVRRTWQTHKSEMLIERVQFEKLEDALNVLELPDDRLMCCGKLFKPIPYRCSMEGRKSKSVKRKAMEEIPNTEIDSDIINKLPEEMLLCKLWRHLGREIPWRTNLYSLILRSGAVEDSVFEAILRRYGLKLKKLNIWEHSLSLKFPIVIGNHCPNLEELNMIIDRTLLSSGLLGVLGQSCPNLKKYELNVCEEVGGFPKLLFRIIGGLGGSKTSN